MDLEDAGYRARFMIRDRDGTFPALFDAVLKDAGIDVVLSGVRMPRMNSIMERWVQTCRRELLDRTLIWNQPHLLHALREFEQFYNGHRPHQGIANARPLHPLPALVAARTRSPASAYEDTIASAELSTSSSMLRDLRGRGFRQVQRQRLADTVDISVLGHQRGRRDSGRFRVTYTAQASSHAGRYGPTQYAFGTGVCGGKKTRASLSANTKPNATVPAPTNAAARAASTRWRCQRCAAAHVRGAAPGSAMASMTASHSRTAHHGRTISTSKNMQHHSGSRQSTARCCSASVSTG